MYLKPEFAAFLQNNDAPSASAILELTESFKAPLNELQEVEAEMQRLGELMETMKTRRQSIQEIINDYNIILSPARRLPPDVLREIFFHCLPTHRNPFMKSSESPLLLTQICSSWRAIALSSPRIWSKVYIPFPGDPSCSPSHGVINDETILSIRRQSISRVLRLRCDAVRGWLSRSGTCPLSLSISYPSAPVEESDSGIQNWNYAELLQEIFDILRSFSDRWGDVDLSMPEDIYNKLQGSIVNPTTFSSLKSLKITLHRSPWNNALEYVPIRLLAAPGLRRININRFPTLRATGNLVQPIWNQITHITFTYLTTDIYLLVLLRQCPNLVFGNFILDSGPEWPPQTIVDQEAFLLPRLESLAINTSAVHWNMDIIFNALNAPALTRVSYRWLTHLFDHENASTILLPIPVIPLLENSTLISYLSLDGQLSSQDTRECLRPGEQVTHLVFERPRGQLPPSHMTDADASYPDRFDLKVLSIGSEAEILLPRLEFLEAYNLASFTDEDLLDLITSRINASQRGETAALKSVKMSFDRRRQKDITEEVSRLAKEAGIEVKLDLDYPPVSQLFDPLSPSFGFEWHNDHDDSW